MFDTSSTRQLLTTLVAVGRSGSVRAKKKSRKASSVLKHCFTALVLTWDFGAIGFKHRLLIMTFENVCFALLMLASKKAICYQYGFQVLRLPPTVQTHTHQADWRRKVVLVSLACGIVCLTVLTWQIVEAISHTYT